MASRPRGCPILIGSRIPGASGDRGGGALPAALRQDEATRLAHGGQRRTLRHPMAAGLAKDEIGGGGEPRCLGFQPRGVEEAGRYAEMAGEGMDRRLGRLEVDGGDAGQRQRREPRLRQRFLGQGDQLLGRRQPLAADAQNDRRRMKQQAVGRRRDGAPSR